MKYYILIIIGSILLVLAMLLPMLDLLGVM